ncbi:RHS repeat-associated core domain-containing protein [Pseudomonas sp. 3A(2025)]
MAVSTSVHSNAFNFMSFLKNGVDPRTGQYTVSITLPDVKTNDLRGPGVPLALVYNPLNTVDSGLGLGWSLQLSQFTPGNRVISLSTGESFKASMDGDNGELKMPEKKIDSFHLYRESSSRYRVMHKSGLVEVLEVQGGASQPVALPVLIQAPEGHSVTLAYAPFNSTWPLLKTVTDASGQTLLSIVRTDYQVLISLYPYAGPEGKPLAVFSLTLNDAHEVTRISLPTDNQASWRFAYSLIGTERYSRITSVQTPTGASEQIVYADQGHLFPARSGLPRLPRVEKHLIDPGSEQPVVEVHYNYLLDHGEHNFLGAGLDIGWSTEGEDNLYQHSSQYLYQSAEILYEAGREVRRIMRTFNQFHLLIEEVTTRGDTIQTVQTVYPYTNSLPFINQRNDCQLPSEVTTRWVMKNGTDPRDETVVTEYDTYGNPVLERQANGVEQTSVWYLGDGTEEGCPRDPEGFVRHLKHQTVTPAAGDGAAQTLRTEYTYVALPALTDSRLAEWLTVEQEVLWLVLATPREQQRTTFSYYDTPAVSLSHGQVQQQTVTLNGKSTVTEYAYSLHDGTGLAESVLGTVQTLTGFDGTTKVITLEHSLLNGEPLLTRDDNDVEIRYQYDVLGRVTRETVAPGSPLYEASRVYTYRLCATPGDRAEQTMLDVKQVKTLTRLDGLNRVIYEERDDADNLSRAGVPRQTYAATYDVWGRLVSETEYDWLDDRQLPLTRRLDYDEWGEQYLETGPDGVSNYQQTNPVGTAQWRGPVQRSWRETAVGNRSGVTETWLNLFEQPVHVERFLAGQDSPVRVSLSESTYDGLGRLHKEQQRVDQAQRSTAYSYDAFDRTVMTTLADGVLVRRWYAEHSSEDLPVRIRVDENNDQKVLGEQVFDGLDRRIEATTGGRKQTFSYAPGQRQPESVTTASGQVIAYEYNPQLGEEPSRRTLPGLAAGIYNYDPQNARLLDCQEQDEHLTRTYFSTGELQSETRRFGAGPDYNMHYRYSRLGRLLSYTDVLGQEQTCTYDTYGRLGLTQLGSLRSVFTYDPFGRTATITTTDTAGGQSLGITLEYDDFDRETLRVFDLDGVEQRMVQHWNAADELVQRTLTEGAEVLRDEHYSYDDHGRLEIYECTGSQPPVDPYGKAIDRQVFIFDGLDNIRTVSTSFKEGGIGSSNRATYAYTGQDPAQLTSITNNHADYPNLISLSYDPDGNLLQDEAGRTLVYDALSRLIEVNGSGGGPGHYRYDPLDTLSGQDGGDTPEHRFYRDGELTTRITGTQNSTYLRGADQVLAERSGNHNRLLAGDHNNTVLNQLDNGTATSNRYTAYGHRDAAPANGGVDFNGELSEPDTGWQLLGNGYRAYNPVLMRFHSPDSLSPFDEGGVNGYMYCMGDPVNQVDPEGHMPLRNLVPLKDLTKLAGALDEAGEAVGQAVKKPAGSVATQAVPPVQVRPGNVFGPGDMSLSSATSSRRVNETLGAAAASLSSQPGTSRGASAGSSVSNSKAQMMAAWRQRYQEAKRAQQAQQAQQSTSVATSSTVTRTGQTGRTKSIVSKDINDLVEKLRITRDPDKYERLERKLVALRTEYQSFKR